MELASKKGGAQAVKMMQNYQGEKSLFHSSALQGLATNSILSNLMSEEGKKPVCLGELIQSVMYGPTPNIVTPALKLPIKHTIDTRFSE